MEPWNSLLLLLNHGMRQFCHSFWNSTSILASQDEVQRVDLSRGLQSNRSWWTGLDHHFFHRPSLWHQLVLWQVYWLSSHKSFEDLFHDSETYNQDKVNEKKSNRRLILTLVQLFGVYHKLWPASEFQSVIFTNLHLDEEDLYPIWGSTLQSFHYLCQRSFEGLCHLAPRLNCFFWKLLILNQTDLWHTQVFSHHSQ